MDSNKARSAQYFFGACLLALLVLVPLGAPTVPVAIGIAFAGVLTAVSGKTAWKR